MSNLINLFDIDYGINFACPLNWDVYFSIDSPIRFAVNPEKSIIIAASILEIDLVKRGLKAISIYIFRNVTECKVKKAYNLYNIEGNLERRFGVKIDSDCGEIYVIGKLEAFLIEGVFGNYYEYFVKCIISEDEKVAKDMEYILDTINRDRKLTGITFASPTITYIYRSLNQYREGEEMWRVSIPYTAILSPQDTSVSILIGGLMGQINFVRYPIKFIDETYLRSLIDKYASDYLGNEYELKILNQNNYELYAEAISEKNMAVVYLKWGNPIKSNDTLVIEHIFKFPITAYYGARKIIDKIINSVKYTPALIGALFQSEFSLLNTNIPRTTASSIVNPNKKTSSYSNSPTRVGIKSGCKNKLTFLRNEINNVKMLLRSLEHDYQTQLWALSNIKTSDIITGMYTFETPGKKLRFIQSKKFSPIMGDRFWEHKDSVYLPHSKGILATRKWVVPRNKHELKKLKWRIEEEIKRVKRDYERRKKELEQKLAELEKEYKECLEKST